ncbi:hypothetical protein [Streptomyces bikiniensis]|uniref:hypothetical protein n=1 Tax=Streptomyces bikiniensis TaxID=1896 RepID=UPI0004C1B31D|nr:hypothetical protein [Streptomyces bikiniensis]
MRRRTGAAPLSLLSLLSLLALAGCGIQETDVVEAGGAATVVVQPVPEERMTLYFLGPGGGTMPMARDVGPHAPSPFPSRTRPADGAGDDRMPYEGFGPGYEVSTGTPVHGRVPTDKVLAALLAGPTDEERATGATTALPGAGGWTPRVEPDPAGTGRAGTDPAGSVPALRLRTPFPVRDLPEAAVRQLVCTAAHAEHPAGRSEVTLTGPDGSLPAARCDD